MARPDLGTKLTCPACSAKFYNLNRNPADCPKCGQSVELVAPEPPRGGRAAKVEKPPEKEAKKPAPAKASDDDEDEDEDEIDADLPDLEEDDEELEGDDVDEDAFLEDEDEEGDDVSGIVKGGSGGGSEA